MLFLRVGGREKIIVDVKYRLWLQAHFSKVGNYCQRLRFSSFHFVKVVDIKASNQQAQFLGNKVIQMLYVGSVWYGFMGCVSGLGRIRSFFGRPDPKSTMQEVYIRYFNKLKQNLSN